MKKHSLALLLLLSLSPACITDVNQDDPDLEVDPDDIEATGQAMSIYGKEINVDARDWNDMPREDTVCKFGTDDKAKPCDYAEKGLPWLWTYYNFLPLEKGRTLKWDAARFYNAKGVSPAFPFVTYFVLLGPGDGNVTVKGQKVGDPLMRIPAVYDNIKTGKVHGSVHYKHGFDTEAKVKKAAYTGNLVLALQQQESDGTWVDLVTKQSPKPTFPQEYEPEVMELVGYVKPNTNIRLELRIGKQYGATPETYYIQRARLFAPVCVPDASGTKCL